MSSRADLQFYTLENICGAMSLRKPQIKSLEILADILDSISPSKNIDKAEAIKKIHEKYPIYTDFERDFMSLTFALATGVGKTRLMGAFIAYLYAQKGIKNFFVVAPGKIIYNKLRNDFGDAGSPKYVFKGLACFDEAPQIITVENYKNRLGTGSNVNIFIFNIDKFNKENAQLKNLNEVLGDSFYKMVSNLDDLVLLMDESHHYRADSGMRAINELKPVLGLELTATPIVISTQEPFKNVVYEYPLKQSIADGYTRSVYALARRDMDLHAFGDKAMDSLMLQDGITSHKKIKAELERYARRTGKAGVKPFMLVVCKNTKHARTVEEYIKSDEFCDGEYRHKTVIVNSKQGKVESETNQELLLDVEKNTNPVEIVIHVNMLKEGWDVNNLYTIVPLRTAASKVLREQMVGRGLRLPYGERTGNTEVDSVILTAHDNFSDIIRESEAGDSIFNKGCIIEASEWFEGGEQGRQTVLTLDETDVDTERAFQVTQLPRTEENTKVIEYINRKTAEVAEDIIQAENGKTDTNAISRKVYKTVVDDIQKSRDLGDIYKEISEPLNKWAENEAERLSKKVIGEFIPIPVIKMQKSRDDVYRYEDFDIDLSAFTDEPIKNDVFKQRVSSPGEEREYLSGYGDIVLDTDDPQKILVEKIREKGDVVYDLCDVLLHKLVRQVCEHYKELYGENGLKNIITMFKIKTADNIYKQLQNHFVCVEKGELFAKINGIREKNIKKDYQFTGYSTLYDNFTGNIKSIGFENMKKSVFKKGVRFDSNPELEFAKLLELEPKVLRWLRPAADEFKFSATRKDDYDPDFVVATENRIYMIEIKSSEKMEDEKVLAKRDKAIEYCRLASDWSKRNGYKEWSYALIPDNAVNPVASFERLVKEYKC